MHFLITGISGQIGRRLSEILKARGLEHRGIDLCDFEGQVPFLKYDLTQPEPEEKLRNFFEPVTHVIHLAAKMSNATDINRDFNEQFYINVVGTLNLLSALPEKILHICFASSMTVYGVPERLPVDEHQAVLPDNLYALCKSGTEKYLQLFSKTRNIPVAILRYSSVYGPGSITHRAISNMIEKAIDGIPPTINGKGETIRDYVYIDDVCHATIIASKKMFSGIMNIGSGIGTSIACLAEEISKNCLEGKDPIYDRSKPNGYSIYYNIQKMKNQLNYSPAISLSKGLSETINWHQERRKIK